MTAARKLCIDDVCAFAWERSYKQFRGGCCALASINQNLSLLDWYEMGEAERAALRPAIAGLIESGASRQRSEWCQKAKRAAA